MSSFQKKVFLYTALGLLFSFFICHFTFSFFNDLESDDFILLTYLRDKGYFGTIKFIYLEWEGAFGVLLISLLKIKFTLLVNSVFIHNVTSCFFTIFCFYYFFKACFKKYLHTESMYYTAITTIIVYCNIYYNNLALNDSWYWLCGSVYFFMPALLMLFIGALINNTNKSLIYLAYIYFFIYGASRFNYSVITLSILTLIFLFYWFTEKKIQKTVLILICIVFVALVIYVVAPGNYIRRNDELKHVLTLKDYMVGPLKMSFAFIMKYLVFKSPFHFLFLFPILFIGYLLKEKLNSLLENPKKTRKTILSILALALFCVYVQCFSMFLAKGSQRERTLEMLSIICTLCLTAIFLIIGSKLNAQKVLFSLSLTCMLCASLLLLRRIYICFPVIKPYAIAVQERHQTIKDALQNFKGDTLKLKKLPPSSWLHSSELGKRNGPTPLNNVFLEEYYKPKFAIDLQN